MTVMDFGLQISSSMPPPIDEKKNDDVSSVLEGSKENLLKKAKLENVLERLSGRQRSVTQKEEEKENISEACMESTVGQSLNRAWSYFSIKQENNGNPERMMNGISDSALNTSNISTMVPLFNDQSHQPLPNNNDIFWQYICAALATQQQHQQQQLSTQSAAQTTTWTPSNFIATGAFTPTNPRSTTSAIHANCNARWSELSVDESARNIASTSFESKPIIDVKDADAHNNGGNNIKVEPGDEELINSNKKHRKRSYRSDRLRGIKMCKECNLTYKTKEEFWTHNRQVHDDGKLNLCPACVFSTKFKHHFDYHLRGHIRSKPYKCTKCDYRCINQSMLRSHISSHRRELRNRCKVCNETFKTLKALEHHAVSSNHQTPGRNLRDVPVTDMGYRMLQALMECCGRSSAEMTCPRPETAAELSEQLNELLNKSKLTGLKEIIDDALFDEEYAEQVLVEAEMYAKNLSSHLYCDRCEFCASTKDEIITHLRHHVEHAKPGEIFPVLTEGSEAGGGAGVASELEDEHKSVSGAIVANSSSPVVSMDERTTCFSILKSNGIKHEARELDEFKVSSIGSICTQEQSSFGPSIERKHRRKETKPTKLARASIKSNADRISSGSRFDPALTCNLCWIPFSDTCSYLTHLSLHDPCNPLRCTKCGFVAEDFQDFRGHCNAHHVQ